MEFYDNAFYETIETKRVRFFISDLNTGDSVSKMEYMENALNKHFDQFGGRPPLYAEGWIGNVGSVQNIILATMVGIVKIYKYANKRTCRSP